MAWCTVNPDVTERAPEGAGRESNEYFSKMVVMFVMGTLIIYAT